MLIVLSCIARFGHQGAAIGTLCAQRNNPAGTLRAQANRVFFPFDFIFSILALPAHCSRCSVRLPPFAAGAVLRALF